MPLSSWPAVTPSAATSRASAATLSVANCAASAMSATASRFAEAATRPCVACRPLCGVSAAEPGLARSEASSSSEIWGRVCHGRGRVCGRSGDRLEAKPPPPPPPARPLLDVPPRGDMRGIEPKESERCRRCSSILAIPPSPSRHGDRFLTPFSAMCVNSSPKTRGGGARAAGGITPMRPASRRSRSHSRLPRQVRCRLRPRHVMASKARPHAAPTALPCLEASHRARRSPRRRRPRHRRPRLHHRSRRREGVLVALRFNRHPCHRPAS